MGDFDTKLDVKKVLTQYKSNVVGLGYNELVDINVDASESDIAIV